MLKQYLVVFNEQAKILVKKLEKESQRGKVFDLWLYMANANIDIITGTPNNNILLFFILSTSIK